MGFLMNQNNVCFETFISLPFVAEPPIPLVQSKTLPKKKLCKTNWLKNLSMTKFYQNASLLYCCSNLPFFCFFLPCTDQRVFVKD